MNAAEILMRWKECKSRFSRKRLDAPCSKQYEYKGKQFGHPSTYAFVRFDCVPADDLVFEMRAEWPGDLQAEDLRRFQSAMAAAVVDVLIGAEDPHAGCSVTCVEVKVDEVCTSERSFYRATKEAMVALRDDEKWSFVPKAKV